MQRELIEAIEGRLNELRVEIKKLEGAKEFLTSLAAYDVAARGVLVVPAGSVLPRVAKPPTDQQEALQPLMPLAGCSSGGLDTESASHGRLPWSGHPALPSLRRVVAQAGGKREASPHRR
jgi:hypothetical protein